VDDSTEVEDMYSRRGRGHKYHRSGGARVHCEEDTTEGLNNNFECASVNSWHFNRLEIYSGP